MVAGGTRSDNADNVFTLARWHFLSFDCVDRQLSLRRGHPAVSAGLLRGPEATGGQPVGVEGVNSLAPLALAGCLSARAAHVCGCVWVCLGMRVWGWAACWARERRVSPPRRAGGFGRRRAPRGQRAATSCTRGRSNMPYQFVRREEGGTYPRSEEAPPLFHEGLSFPFLPAMAFWCACRLRAGLLQGGAEARRATSGRSTSASGRSSSS